MNTVRAVSRIRLMLFPIMLLLTACTSPSNGDTGAADPSSASDRHSRDNTLLKFVLLGEAPKDNDAVMVEVNKKLAADIQATIELTYIPLTDVSTRYPLVLASPHEWDVIYGNINYGSNASKGGYREIAMDDVNAYMPLTAMATTQEQWSDTMVDGKIYMIPQTFKELDLLTGFFREDLRRKYNVPEIKTFKDLGAYFQALKVNEEEMQPVDGSFSDIQGLFSGLMQSYVIKEAPYITGFFAGDPNYEITGLLDDPFKAKFIDAATTMKEWADRDYLPKNPYAHKETALDLARTGKTGYWSNAFENYVQYSLDMTAKGWTLGAVNNVSASGFVMTRSSTGNGFAISPKSKNYERALMAIDRLHQDKSYNMLLAFGIEGNHYTMDKNGKLIVVQPDPNPYPLYGAGWWSNNRDQWPPLESYTPDYIDMKRGLLEKAQPYVLNSFNVDTTNIKSELALIANIDKQYAVPIQLGLVPEVNGAVEDLIDRYKKAGAEKVLAEVRRQAARFIASKQNK